MSMSMSTIMRTPARPWDEDTLLAGGGATQVTRTALHAQHLPLARTA